MAGARGRSYNMNYSYPPYTRVPPPRAPPPRVSQPRFPPPRVPPPHVNESIFKEEFQKLKKRRGDGPEMELRLLVRGRNAGAIIGKAGSNIRRVKQEFRVNVLLTDTSSPERILSIMGDLGSICEAILDLTRIIDNNPPSDAADDVDVRVLMHHSLTGHVIRKSGQGIRELKDTYNTTVKVYKECCPKSTDRVVQINGRPVDIVNCIVAIVEMVIMVPPMGLILPYNPNNFMEIKALDYGGFTGYDVTVPFQGATVKLDTSKSTTKSGASNEDEPDGATGRGFDNPSLDQNRQMSAPDSGPSYRQNAMAPGYSESSFTNPRAQMGPGYSESSFTNPRAQMGMDPQGQWTPNSRGPQGSFPPSQYDTGFQQTDWRSSSQGQGFSSDYPAGRGQSMLGQSSMGQSSMGHDPMGQSFMGHASSGHYSANPGGSNMEETGQMSGGPSTQRPQNSRGPSKPIDHCQGLGFHPVDARTVRVGIPKVLQTIVMGHRGTAIKDIRSESKAKIIIEVPPAGAVERYLTLMGTPEQLQKAQYLLQMRYLDGKNSYTQNPEEFMNRGTRKRRLPDAPWMTDEIMKMKLVRRKLERVWRTGKKEEAKKAFKDYCLEMNKAIKIVKEEYYKIHGGAPEKKQKQKPEGEGDGTNPVPEGDDNSSQGEGDNYDDLFSDDASNAATAATELNEDKVEVGAEVKGEQMD